MQKILLSSYYLFERDASGGLSFRRFFVGKGVKLLYRSDDERSYKKL